MSDTNQRYRVQFSHPIYGSVVLGSLTAQSAKDAQLQAIELLKEHGMPEKNIAYDAPSDSTIILKDGVIVTIASVLSPAHQ